MRVGYRPLARNNDCHDCWFFIMRLAHLTQDRIGSKNKWAGLVLEKSNVSIDDFFILTIEKQLIERKTFAHDIEEAIADFKRLVA
jgi:hypothetical protein